MIRKIGVAEGRVRRNGGLKWKCTSFLFPCSGEKDPRTTYRKIEPVTLVVMRWVGTSGNILVFRILLVDKSLSQITKAVKATALMARVAMISGLAHL